VITVTNYGNSVQLDVFSPDDHPHATGGGGDTSGSLKSSAALVTATGDPIGWRVIAATGASDYVAAICSK
jgi:hypothetical protein